MHENDERKMNLVAMAVPFLLILIVGVPFAWKNAHSVSDANSPLRVIEYKNDGSTVKVVYDHRRIANLDRNVTELQTKLGSAGWTPTGEWFAMANVVPKGCVIHVVASEKESDTAQSKYALEGCDPSMSFTSILFSSRVAGYTLGTYGYSGYRLITQNRRQ